MYIRKQDLPRTGRRPDGSVISRGDLPATDTTRWTAARKALVVDAIGAGILDKTEAIKLYDLSLDELREWTRARQRGGVAALRARNANASAGAGSPSGR